MNIKQAENKYPGLDYILRGEEAEGEENSENMTCTFTIPCMWLQGENCGGGGGGGEGSVSTQSMGLELQLSST